MTIKLIKDPIYGIKTTFIFNEKKEKVVNFLKGKVEKDYSDMWEDSGAFFCTDGNNFNYYIVIKDSVKDDHKFLSHLVHECLHVTSRALRVRGFELTDESEEAFTYYICFLVREFLRIYESSNRKKANGKARKNINRKKYGKSHRS